MTAHSEAELLRRWLDLLLETDPDLVIGYNIINFDLPYLYDRAAVSSMWPVVKGRDVQCSSETGLLSQQLWHCSISSGHIGCRVTPAVACSL